MQYVLALVSLCLILQTSCLFRAGGGPSRKLTGTCKGACDHYIGCKSATGQRVGRDTHEACVQECHEVFTGRESLLAFESLSCEDTVAFVEGDTGRGPGAALLR